MINEVLSPQQIDFLICMFAVYRPKQEILDWSKVVPFGVIMGPAGSGKDTLREALIRRCPGVYSTVLSDTSRSPRASEREGVEYHFKSLEAMLEGYKTQDYLQGAIVHQQHISGIKGSDLLELPEGRIPLSILVIQTVMELSNKGLQLKGLFLVPPSLHIMQERLSVRQGVAMDEQARRFRSAIDELTIALEHVEYQFIVTEDVSRSVSIANNFFTGGIIDQEEQQKARQAAKQLLVELQKK